MPANPAGMSAFVDLVARARASRIWRETRNDPDRELQHQAGRAPVDAVRAANTTSPERSKTPTDKLS